MRYIVLLFIIAWVPKFQFAVAEQKDSSRKEAPQFFQAKKMSIESMMTEVHERISKWNWDKSLFPKTGWKEKSQSVYGRPLIYWTCGSPKNENVSLFLSAVHGDEVTPIYFGFRLVEWIKARPELCENSYIVVAPLVNPDGFLRYTNGTRTNYNKVDLNRNFDTPEWDVNALKIWKEKYKSQRRYFPGDFKASEPEIHFQKWLIDEFKPTKILSIHAPLNHLDFDGPTTAQAQKFTEEYIRSCDYLKKVLEEAKTGLRVFAYGTFPGSLGNYAGRLKGIPTITVELPTIDYRQAGNYFSNMEKGLHVFINYKMQSKPNSLAKED